MPTRICVYSFSWRWRCTSSRPRTRVYQSIELSILLTVNEKCRTTAIIRSADERTVTVRQRSQKQPYGGFEQFSYRPQKRRGVRAIDDPVVTDESDRHDRLA